uniref:Uncharacterized protein n=1 Tax=Takifugu rubripes TaxID=31033 RepID=A0A674MCL2_TAKRU
MSSEQAIAFTKDFLAGRLQLTSIDDCRPYPQGTRVLLSFWSGNLTNVNKYKRLFLDKHPVLPPGGQHPGFPVPSHFACSHLSIDVALVTAWSPRLPSSMARGDCIRASPCPYRASSTGMLTLACYDTARVRVQTPGKAHRVGAAVCGPRLHMIKGSNVLRGMCGASVLGH